MSGGSMQLSSITVEVARAWPHQVHQLCHKPCRVQIMSQFIVSGSFMLSVTTVTVPTPIRPILTCLRPSQVIRITPKHPMPNPNPLAPSQANLHLTHP